MPGAAFGYRGIIGAFWAVESGKLTGRSHSHCLLLLDHFRQTQTAQSVWQYWFERYGAAKVEKIKSEGASFYVTKYILKDIEKGIDSYDFL